MFQIDSIIKHNVLNVYYFYMSEDNCSCSSKTVNILE